MFLQKLHSKAKASHEYNRGRHHRIRTKHQMEKELDKYDEIIRNIRNRLKTLEYKETNKRKEKVRH